MTINERRKICNEQQRAGNNKKSKNDKFDIRVYFGKEEQLEKMEKNKVDRKKMMNGSK